MSHISKKGKKLTTKRTDKSLNNKKSRRNSLESKDASLFESFMIRDKKHETKGSQSDKPSNKSGTDEENEDFFKFPNDTTRKSAIRNIFTDKTIQSNIFEEETRFDNFLDDSCLKINSVKTLNDSSLVFKSESIPKFEKEIAESSAHKDEVVSYTKDSTSIEEDDVKIPDREQKVFTSPIKENDPVENDGNVVPNQCPICLKMVSKYLTHMKACAAKNKLSTHQLLSALKLHRKQLAERKQLGLEIPVQNFRARVSPKKSKTNDKKGPVDSSLQLALALSASLHSAQENEVIQEAEALKEAGLTDEADQKLSTLEKYGFASALPVQPRSIMGGPKSRPLPTLLLKRTQEERERIITEKVAIILINEEEIMRLEPFIEKEPVLKSKILKGNWNKETYLWNKAHCPGNEGREAFYVSSLAQFVSPSKAEVGESLRRLSQLPGRLNTPAKEEMCNLPTPCKSFKETKEDDISDISTPLRSKDSEQYLSSSQNETEDISDMPTPLRTVFQSRDINSKSALTRQKRYNSSYNLSEDWSKLVNSYIMSDIKVKCKDGLIIPAHKLVFYVRCPRILNELSNHDALGDVLLWEDYSESCVLAFLEYLYCGRLNMISDDLYNVQRLAEHLEYKELIYQLQGRGLNSNKCQDKALKKELFKENSSNKAESEITYEYSSQKKELLSSSFNADEDFKMCGTVPNSQRISSSSNFDSRNEAEDCRYSPDMFGDSNVIDDQTEVVNQSQQGHDDLEILISLMGKPTQITEANDEYKPSESDKITRDSPNELQNTSVTSTKRKAPSNSCSEDEDNGISHSKKHCSDFSTSVLLESKNISKTFDLTQSSNSSNEAAPNASQDEYKISGSIIIDESDDEVSLYNLTQNRPDKSPSNVKEPVETKNVNKPTDDIDEPEISRLSNKYSVLHGCDTPKSVLCKENNLSLSPTTVRSPLKRFSQSPSNRNNNFSLSKDCVETEAVNESTFDGYIDPVWNDYYFEDDHFNNEVNSHLITPLKVPQNNSLVAAKVKIASSDIKNNINIYSTNKILSNNHNSPESKSTNSKPQIDLNSTPGSSHSIKYISSNSKSPTLLSDSSSNKRSPTAKSVSLETRSPKLSQRTLLDYSPSSKNTFKKCNNNSSTLDPDVEFVSESYFKESVSSQKSSSQKSRKNLSSVFESSLSSLTNSSSGLSKGRATSMEVLEDDTNKKDTSQNKAKTPSKKDSLAAMQRLLDDSFEINESALLTADDSLVLQDNQQLSNKPSKNSQGQNLFEASIMTPSPEIIVSDKVTPLPDYSAMKTPALKKELSRFGLKPSLGRRKAKMLLRYIYDETHPLVPDPKEKHDSQTDNEKKKDILTDGFKLPQGQPPPSPVKSPRKAPVTLSVEYSESDSDDPCSQRSTSSISSGISIPEESYFEDEDILTQELSNSGDLKACIRQLIVCDHALHRQVVMYEPIYLEDMLARLKANGIKCKASDVMDYLDEQCITFRTKSWKKTNEKRRQKQLRKKQNSPRKKKQCQGTSETSPIKSQSQALRKRGRPKKN